MKHEHEVDILEEQLAEALGAPLERVRARRAACPPLTLLRAAASDALSAEHHEEVEQHLQNCALCQALVADLQSDELTAPTAAEAHRIRAKVDAETTKRKPGGWAWAWRPAAVVASIAVVVWIGWRALQRGPALTPPHPPAAAIPFAMPEAKLRPSVALLSRGENAATRYLEDLGPAMKAYRAGDYGVAAREFGVLEKKYPNQVEVLFYNGVTQLKLGASDKAVAALEGARALNDSAFADDIAWYLGIAYQRAGNMQAAHTQFVQLCREQREYAARACEAARETAAGRQ